MAWLRCLLLTTLAGLLLSAHAQALVSIEAGVERVSVQEALSWWQSADPAATLEQARQARFVPVDAGPNHGLRTDPVWFRLEVHNASPQARNLLLEIAFAKLDELDLHIVHGDGRVESWLTGEARPWATRPLHSPHFLFPVNLAADESASLYLRVVSSTVVNVPVSLHDAGAYLGVVSGQQGWQGVFYGLALGLLVYNGFLFRATRETALLHYVVGGAFAVGYFLALDGYLAMWLGAWPHFAQSLLFACGLLSVAFIMLFVRGFLGLKALAPRIDRVVGLLVPVALVTALVLPWLSLVLAVLCTLLLCGAMAGLMALASLRSWQAGFAPARWFLLALLMLCLLVLLLTVAVLGVWSGPFDAIYLFSRAGFILCLVCFSLAIGERIRLLDQEKRRAEEAALAVAADMRARTEFLSRMSHELRTPMTGVLGMAELLEHGELSSTQRRYLGTLRYSGEMLLNLINDVLDYARIQTGRLQLRREAFDLLRVIDECRVLFDQQPRDAAVTLGIDLGGGLSRVAVGDGTRVRQVLVNLLAQAFRQTGRGNVCLRARAAAQAGWIRFEVEIPGGEGLEVARQLLAENAPGGAGLGLVISRLLVEAMGGRIGVDGGGETRYWCELPLNPAA